MTRIYKLLDRSEWLAAEAQGLFDGSAVDAADGYIHFSTAAQLGETGRRYFTGRANLVLLAVDAAALGEALRWEPSRGGDLFPHLYAPLPIAQVIAVRDVALGPDGAPALEPAHLGALGL